MEYDDKSPLSKAVPRHRIPKNGVFRGRCPPLKGEERGARSGGKVRAKSHCCACGQVITYEVQLV